ncbi:MULTISPECIES: hypothetical protein [Providencia]|uniref:Pilus assembly protein PilO n=1 Tax=Providencia huaxiensis TaxID=2027290 RepID=A0ABU2IT87_9GAMM|nr:MULTISPECIES: hypothetical protein [Providencia]MBZ3680806.1 hypothetical protein [Providencia rettgeri]AXH63345.1 hypothetical protein CYG50_15675 [Providencia huaxiensis]MDT0131845.1 hypothetical protein [Providencia huaxiensis]MDT1978251.1 hypothetical protein [Providencia huaxiensis]QLR01396.1 hypothetical protein H0912_01000 [Providencia rettgeri]
MSESTHSFWYRPFWQQTLPVWFLIALCISMGYFLHWKENQNKIMELDTENLNLIEAIAKETKIIHRSPSLQQLEKQAQLLKQSVNIQEAPLESLTQLNILLSHSSVTLNQLQPTDINTYFMELQGTFIPIYHVIEQLLTLPQTQKWHFHDIKIYLKQGIIVTTISFSLFNNSLAIKDDNHNE